MQRSGAVVLGTLALVALVAAGAVAVTTLLGGGPSALDQVPAGADAVVRVDAAIADDPVSRELARAGAERAALLGLPAANRSTLVARFEAETGLDPDRADELVAFGWRGDGTAVGSGGVIVHGDWSEAELREAVVADGTRNRTATTHSGRSVYRPVGDADGVWLGVLGDGQYVVGSERAVRRSVEVVAGDRPAVDGRLRSAFDAAGGELVTFAARVPADEVPAASGRAVDLTRYRQVAVVAGSYETTETGVSIQLRLRTNSTEAAQDVADVTSGGLALARGTASNETVEGNLRAIAVEREGRTVVVTYERSVGAVEALLRYYRGLGESGGERNGTAALARATSAPVTATASRPVARAVSGPIGSLAEVAR